MSTGCPQIQMNFYPNPDGPAMISSLKEQINSTNKPEVNKTLQIQFDAIRSVDDDIEKVDSMILQKKALLKESKDVHEPDRLFAELDGLEMVAAANREILLRIKKKNQWQ
jgi:hypothetical protein